MKKLVFVLFFVCLACNTAWAQTSLAWAKKIGGFGNNTDQGKDVFTDALGNVYTTGYFIGTADFDPNAGVLLLTSTGIIDAFIQKLDVNGNLIWAKNIGGTLTSDGIRIQLDGAGNVYVMGTFQGNIDLDPNAGTVNATSNGNKDIFVLKLDSNGNLIWGKTFGGSGVEFAGDMLLDNVGNIYLTGYFQATVDFDPNTSIFNMTVSGSAAGGFLQKLDISGNFIWAKKIGGNSFESGVSIALETSGNIILTGYFQGTTDFDPNAGIVNITSSGLQDAFILKLNSNGEYIWVKKIGGNATAFSTKVCIGLSGDLYVSGHFMETVDFDPNAGVTNIASAGNFDVFLLKLNSSGNLIWVKTMGGIDEEYIWDIVLDNCENIYTTGAFKSSVDFDPNAGVAALTSNGFNDIFIQKLDKDGNLSWVRRIGGTSLDTAFGISLQADNILLTGFFYDTVNFNPNVGTPLELTALADDIFIAKYTLGSTTLNTNVFFEPTPTILNPFIATCLASPPQTFQVKGENLSANLVATAPIGYEISLTFGGTYSSSLNITPNCGTVLPTTVYIRLKAGLALGTYNGNVVLSSTGATSQNLAVTGTVQASLATATIALASSYCLNSPAVTLSATPSGGNFTIDNASFSQFNPSVLGLGNKVVKYNFLDANGCLASTTLNVLINPLPTLSNNVNLSYGSTQTGFTITGLPAGSTYTMNGTPVIEFLPSTWGAGTHTLVQTATVNGCTNILSKTINITEPPTLTSTAGATCWAGTNVSVDANMTVAGATPMTGAIVNFGAGYNSAQDRLIYPIPLFGVTGTFNVATGVLALVGNATTVQYQQIFRSIQYQNISVTPNYGATRTINFTAGDALPLYPCGSTDAHFYKFVSASRITWQNAKLAAEGQNYFGLKGYLATIMCVTENNFAFNSIGRRGWIGASDDAAFTGTYSPNGEGQWYWVTGPEAGTRFWQGLANGIPIGGFYNNWEAGEPNNFQNSNESFAHILENGRWNDYKFNDNNIFGYYIEFGGLATDPSIQNTTTTKQIRLATKLDFAISPKFCENVPAIPLVGSPNGGIFKVNGNIATTFNPSVLGVGNYTITYELAGCTISTSKTTVVNALPAPAIVGLNTAYCADIASFTLIGMPTGGNFTINGGVATQFNPVALGAGNYTVGYTFTNAEGCSKITSQDVLITPLPTAEIVGLNNFYCISQASLGLNGNPAGGNFQINNQNASTLDPQALGAGKHIVSYTIVNTQNCTKTTTQEIEILPLPTLSFANVPDEYCSQASPLVLQANPSGGTFTLNGVPSTTLNPADFAVGDDVTVEYDYISPQGCANSISKNVRIIFSTSFIQTNFEVALCPAQAGGERLEAITLAEEQTLIATNGQLQYKWSNGAKTRFITLRGTEDSGIYKVLIESALGCPLRDFTFKVKVKCETKLSLPTAFTPNGDGKNDVWEIFGEDFTKLDLRVYNRWGELVFISNNQNKMWDGNVGGKSAPAGVYVWTVSYANPLTPEKLEKLQGRVTILR